MTSVALAALAAPAFAGPDRTSSAEAPADGGSALISRAAVSTAVQPGSSGVGVAATQRSIDATDVGDNDESTRGEIGNAADEAGDTISNAADEAGDAIDNAADEAGEAISDAFD